MSFSVILERNWCFFCRTTYNFRFLDWRLDFTYFHQILRITFNTFFTIWTFLYKPRFKTQSQTWLRVLDRQPAHLSPTPWGSKRYLLSNSICRCRNRSNATTDVAKTKCAQKYYPKPSTLPDVVEDNTFSDIIEDQTHS